MATSNPHALLFPCSFQGDLNPFLELAKKLLSAGFRVTLASTQVTHRRILDFLDRHEARDAEASSDLCEGPNACTRGDAPLPAERYVAVSPQDGSESKPADDVHGHGISHLRLVSLEDGLPATFKYPADVINSSVSPTMKAAVEALILRLLQEEHPITCLVADLRTVFVRDIGNKLGIPCVAFWVQAAANLLSTLVHAQGFQAPPDDSALITAIPTLPPHKRSEVSCLFFEKLPGPPVSYECLWEPYVRIKEAKCVVINTCEEIEATTLDEIQKISGFRPLAIGPLVSTPMFSVVEGITEHQLGELEDACMKWLQDRPPASVLYIAFGTVATFSKQQLEELVIGLEASQQHFLWAFRPGLCGDLGDATVGSVIERIRKQGMIVPWAQQWQVLCHPSVGGFLTHCGWNSTLEGITAGVPVLGWPQFVDQFMNLRCVEEKWGIGIRLNADDPSGWLVSRAEVASKVRQLMQGETGRQLKERARALSVGAKGATADGGSSGSNFEAFLKGTCKSL